MLFVATVLHCVIRIKKRVAHPTAVDEEDNESVRVEENDLKCPHQGEISDITIKDEYTEEFRRSEFNIMSFI